MRIDVHAHYWTNAYLDRLVELGRTDTAAQRGIGAADGAELDARLRLMDRAGIDMQVLSAAPQLPYAGDTDRAIAAARYVNDEYAALVAAHPDRFRAFAATPMPHIGAVVSRTLGPRNPTTNPYSLNSITARRFCTCILSATGPAHRLSASIGSRGWWARRSRTPSRQCS